jgi:predicted AAA+ superfamily ATPase
MAQFLDKIYAQNPWFKSSEEINNDINIVKLNQEKYIWDEKIFLNHDFQDGVYLIFGLRQIGKTTHLKRLFKNKMTVNDRNNFFYFNCDYLDTKKEIIDLVEEYLANFPDLEKRIYIALDEISSVKDSIIAVKYLIDSGKYRNISYLLTGSSSINIKKTGEYLPGRRGQGVDFNFQPLSFHDFFLLIYPQFEQFISDINQANIEKMYSQLKHEINLESIFDMYLTCGGIPKVINEYTEKRSIDISMFDIYKDWIVSEIAKSDKREYLCRIMFERILNSLSSDVSYNSFIQDANIGSHNTVYDYIYFMENVFILTQLYHFDYHRKKVNYRKNKKIYFNDPFIIWIIDKWVNAKSIQDFNYLNNPVHKSQIVENIIANELHSKFDGILYYYKNRYEIDFVNKDMILEVKYQNKIIPDDFSHIQKIRGYNKKILATRNDLLILPDILIIPAVYFLLIKKMLI